MSDGKVTSSTEHPVPLHGEVVPGGSLPYAQELTLDDVDSCVEVEDAAFPPNERASREKFIYRLTACSELCLGAFMPADGDVTAPINAQRQKPTLVGHIVSTMSDQDVVTDNDMAFPTPDNPDPQLGHKPHGRTVCLHSLAVSPARQKQRIGTTLMKAYIDRLKKQDLGDRLALIAHDYLVSYYEKFGFISLGPSKAQFGGGGWYDMVLNLKNP